MEWPKSSWPLLLQTVLKGRAKEIGEDFKKLTQLILVEEFKNCVHSDVKTHLNEQKVENLSQAARLADDFALTHKMSASRSFPFRYGDNRFRPCSNEQRSVSGNSNIDKQTVSSKNSYGNKPGEAEGASHQYKKFQTNKPVECNYCHMTNHTMSNCWALKRKKEKQSGSQGASSVGLTIIKSNASPNVEKEVAKRVDSDSVDKRYKPFITEGFVSLDGDSTNTKRIHILRDTGATQSLLLGVLPLSEDSSAGASVLIQGV